MLFSHDSFGGVGSLHGVGGGRLFPQRPSSSSPSLVPPLTPASLLQRLRAAAAAAAAATTSEPTLAPVAEPEKGTPPPPPPPLLPESLRRPADNQASGLFLIREQVDTLDSF